MVLIAEELAWAQRIRMLSEGVDSGYDVLGHPEQVFRPTRVPDRILELEEERVVHLASDPQSLIQ